MRLRELPTRWTTGAYVLHTGWQKWHGDQATAQAVHAMATTAYPWLARLSPQRFLRLLAATEITTGALLLTPIIPAPIAGAALTGFSTGLLGLYARTPGLRQPGSIWPTPQGLPISKDIWMLGIGLSLLTEACPRHDDNLTALTHHPHNKPT
ncbi:hypothetical protein ACIGXM_37115 [Kitasatospora sp. NPDC052896]|uniref:hypothetical protein n=1 Tax=Kitasatospora sp. NPDC052896 TaxID=3364061 RepID=UPI0037CB4FF6